MAKRVRLGDVVEIETPAGLGYAQYTHEHKTYRELIRVLPGLYQQPAEDPVEIAQTKDALFYTFYPVRIAIREGLIRFVVNAPVPSHAVQFPTMRAGGLNLDKETMRQLNWWIWDGSKEIYVGALTPQLAKLPNRGMLNHEGLVSMVSRQQRPEDEWSPVHLKGPGVDWLGILDRSR